MDIKIQSYLITVFLFKVRKIINAYIVLRYSLTNWNAEIDDIFAILAITTTL